MRTYVPASVPFPGLSSSVAELRKRLSELSLTDTLFWCARINQVVSNPHIKSELDRQLFFTRQFLKLDQVERIDKFAAKYGGADNIVIAFRGQILELIRWTLLSSENSSDDGTSFESPEVKEAFAESLLICSQIWSDNIYSANPKTRSISLTSARKAISSTAGAIDITTVMGRAELLVMNILGRTWNDFEEQFLSATGIRLEDYYNSLCAVYLNYVPLDLENKKFNGVFDLDGLAKSVPHFASQLQSTVRLESQSIEQLRIGVWGKKTTDTEKVGPVNYSAIRKGPILASDDGRHIILDPTILSEKMAVGPMFHITRASKDDKFVHDCFARFGYAFEAYVAFVLSAICRRQRSRHSMLFEAPLLKQKSSDEISDAAFIYSEDLILFESKGKWIKETATWSDAEATFVKELLDKYGIGIEQLSRSTRELNEGRLLPGAGYDFSNIKRVYPVLVVYDSLFDSPGHTAFFAEKFAEHAPLGERRSDGMLQLDSGLLCAPLVVLTCNSLEILETSCKDFDLLDALSGFAKAFYETGVSFWDYLSNAFPGKLRGSSLLADYGLRLLERTGQTVFPEHTFSRR